MLFRPTYQGCDFLNEGSISCTFLINMKKNGDDIGYTGLLLCGSCRVCDSLICGSVPGTYFGCYLLECMVVGCV